MRTIREMYCDQIANATTDEEIKAAYEAMVGENEKALLEDPDPNHELNAKELTDTNLGYMLGYYDTETRERWYGLLGSVSHPIFGHGFGCGNDPTPEEALEKGQEMAEATDEGN